MLFQLNVKKQNPLTPCSICNDHYEMLLIPFFLLLTMCIWFVIRNCVPISKNERQLGTQKIIINDEKFGLQILFFTSSVYFTKWYACREIRESGY